MQRLPPLSHRTDTRLPCTKHGRSKAVSTGVCEGRTAPRMTDPFLLFDAWYAEARETEINDSNAMALATADARGRPSLRMVRLKGHGPDGFVFYTHFEGRKAADLHPHPPAALLFPWKSPRPHVTSEGPL